MVPLRRWPTRRIAALWLAAILLEVGLVAGVRAYGDAVFAREHRALLADAGRRGIAKPNSTHDLQAAAADSAQGVQFDSRMQRLIAAQQTAMALTLALALATVGVTVAWAWLRVRADRRPDAAPPGAASQASDASARSLS